MANFLITSFKSIKKGRGESNMKGQYDYLMMFVKKANNNRKKFFLVFSERGGEKAKNRKRMALLGASYVI